MALLKEIETSSSVKAAYWRIGVLSIQPRTGNIFVVMDGYTSEDARRKNNDPFTTKELSMALTPELADGGRSAIYAALVKTPDFEGAPEA